MPHSRLISFITFLSTALALLCAVASATPSINLSRNSGPPTVEILVSGTGFDPNVEINIYFDSKSEAQVMSDSQGDFMNAEIHAPRASRPGKHLIKAIDADNERAQRAFYIRSNWRQFHRLNMVRFNPHENVLNPKNVGNLQLLWTDRIKVGSSSSPAVVDGVLYIGSKNNAVYALKADSGHQLWKFSTGGWVVSSPAVVGGVVYFGCGGLYAVDARTGAQLWSYNTGSGVFSSPAVAKGVVYFGSLDGYFYALDAKTGALRWQFATGNLIYASPVVAGGVVYTVSQDGSVYALNAATGALLWSYADIYEPWEFAAANGIVYVASTDGMYALDASAGGKLWFYGTYNTVFASPAMAYRLLFFGDDDGVLHALHAETGIQLWDLTLQPEIRDSPAVANGVVYFGGGRFTPNIFAVDANKGTVLWSYTAPGQIISSPAVVDSRVYFGSDGAVYAFGLPDGDPARSKTRTLR